MILDEIYAYQPQHASDRLDTGHLKFIPFEPALTTTAVVVWKKYRLLSKSSEDFLQELKKRVQQT